MNLKLLLRKLILFLFICFFLNSPFALPQNESRFELEAGVWNLKVSGFTKSGENGSEVDLRTDNSFEDKNISAIGLNYKFNNNKTISLQYFTDSRYGFNFLSRDIKSSGGIFFEGTSLTSVFSFSALKLMYENIISKKNTYSLKFLSGIYYLNFSGRMSGTYFREEEEPPESLIPVPPNGLPPVLPRERTLMFLKEYSGITLPKSKIPVPLIGLGIEKKILSNKIVLFSDFSWFEGRVSNSSGRVSEINIGGNYPVAKNISVSIAYKSSLVNGRKEYGLCNIKYDGVLFMVKDSFD